MIIPLPAERARRHVRRRVGGVVAAVAALALLTTASGCSSEVADSQDVVGKSRHGAGATAGSSPICDPPPSQTQLRQARSVGFGGEKSSNVFLDFITAVGQEAGTFGEDQGLGWLLNVLGGGQKDQTPAMIKALTDDVDAKTAALQTQIRDVCNLLDTKLDTLETNTTRDSYDSLAGVADGHASKINTWWREYQNILKALKQGAKVDDLGTDRLRQLADMRDNLTNEMDQIHVNLMPSSGGAEGAIVVYAHLLSDQAGYSPTKVAQYPGTHVFPADYVNAAYDMSEYYTSQLALGMYLYSEVTHLAFPNVNSDAHPYTVQPDLASDYATVSAGYSNDFARQVSAGTDNYLKTGIGRIPAGTVLDYRDHANPRLWSNAPVALTGDATSTAGYCPTVSTICYLKTYDKDGALGDLRVTRTSWAPLPTMIGATSWQGIDGWRVPTTADWNAVQAGAGDAGLTASAHPMGMTIFDRTATTLHVKGADSTVQAIAPTLVNTGTAGAPAYGLLTSVDAKDKTLTARSLTSDATNAEGGTLFLVQDFTSTTNAPAPQPAPKGGPKHGKPRRPGPKTPKLNLPDPTTFSTATSCQAYTVPVGASAVTVTATGGTGADGYQNGNATASGGRGGIVTATIPVVAGTKLYVRVGVNATDNNGTANGGGSAGSVDSVLIGKPRTTGGAGGGMSGVSSYADCGSFLAVAGGGGGGGAGLTIPESMPGGKGGDSCLISGSTATNNATCVAAIDGAAHLKVAKGSSPYSDSGGKAGGGPGKATGGAAGTAKPYDETTYNQPGNKADGIGGGAGGGFGSSQAHAFGGGGGGGAGYLGGGGGGGGGNIGAGGGGGGGTSFIANGLPTKGAFSLAAKNAAPSVTITPIADPLVLQSTTSGELANIAGGASADGTPLIQFPRSNSWNERWLVQPVSDADPGELTIVNPTTGKCLSASSSAQNGQIALAACASKAGQRWRMVVGTDGTATFVSALDAPGDGRLVLSTDRDAPLQFGASLTLALDTGAPGQRWSMIDSGW